MGEEDECPKIKGGYKLDDMVIVIRDGPFGKYETLVRKDEAQLKKEKSDPTNYELWKDDNQMEQVIDKNTKCKLIDIVW